MCIRSIEITKFVLTSHQPFVSFDNKTITKISVKCYENLIFVFLIEKPGQCSLKQKSGGECIEGTQASECQNDFDCFGSSKCCNDGCSSICVLPVESEFNFCLSLNEF